MCSNTSTHKRTRVPVLIHPSTHTQEEGITALERIAPREDSSSLSPEEAELLKNTLICFVLVDALGRHSFCSLYGKCSAFIMQGGLGSLEPFHQKLV